MSEITSKLVQQYNVPKSPGMDPCQIIIEDHDGAGEATIKCWTTSATYYWGSPGGNFKEFLTRLDFDYWAGKLFPNANRYFMGSETEDAILDKICKYRREGELDSHEAREAWLYFKNEVSYSSESEYFNEIGRKDFTDFIEGYSNKSDWKCDAINELFDPMYNLDPVTSYDPHVCQIWLGSWVPFIKHLCEVELKIPYKEPHMSEELKKRYGR